MERYTASVAYTLASVKVRCDTRLASGARSRTLQSLVSAYSRRVPRRVI